MAKAKKPRYMAGELGSTGRAASAIWSSMATEEYLAALKWPQNIGIYEKMRRSDSQVQAMLLVIELPIRSTHWFVEPYSDSKQDEEIADFISSNLFDGPPSGLTQHWDDFLRLALTMLPFGHAVFEKVFELQDGKVRWRKFAPRPVSTVSAFTYDEQGGPKGVKHLKLADTGYSEVFIPVEKLLIFSNRMEGGDLRGQSVLRSAYRNWLIKDFLYKITNIGIERNFVGTPQITLPPEWSDDDYNRAIEIVEDLRSAEKAGVVLPPEYVLSLFEGKRGMMEVLPYIDHQDQMILRSVLAQFINLGSGDVGSFALSQDHSNLFLMTLDATAKSVAAVLNSYAIPQLVDYNWQVEGYPRVTFRPIGQSSEKLVQVLAQLVQGQLVAPDEDLEAWVRELLDLPEKAEVTEDAPASAPPPPPDGPPPASGDSPPSGQQPVEEPTKTESPPPNERKNPVKAEEAVPETQGKWAIEPDQPSVTAHTEHGCPALTPSQRREVRRFAEGERQWSRELTEREKAVGFAELEAWWDGSEEAFVEDGMSILSKQLLDLFEQVRRALESGKVAEISRINPRYLGEFTNWLRQRQSALAGFGIERAASELGIDAAKVEVPDRTKDTWSARAGVLAKALTHRLQMDLTLFALGAYDDGLAASAAAFMGREQVLEKAKRELVAMASAVVGEAVNTGRDLAAQMAGVELAQYSAILDEKTCPLCEYMDGKIINLGNPDYKRFSPLIHFHCRCVWVYILPEETPQPEEDWETPPDSLVDGYGVFVQ